MAPGTFDEHLLCWLGAREEGLSQGDSDRIRSVAEEFAAGFSGLAPIERAVTIFGSARTPQAGPEYSLAGAVAACLAGSGYAIITTIVDAACERQRDHHRARGR